MKINITAKVDVQPHKVSKATDLPTISEQREVDFGGRRRAEMRRTWMRHARMTQQANINNINPVQTQARHIQLSEGLNMLYLLNLRGIH